LYDDIEGLDTYYLEALDLSGTWGLVEGAPDAPTATNTTSNAPIANGGGVQMPLANNITYELGRYAYPTYNLYAVFQLAELIIYNSRLTTPQRQQVETYLNDKYAIY
jgi:hypothetical protein